jgi:tetratricopeptide (TPR) repeat protein
MIYLLFWLLGFAAAVSADQIRLTDGSVVEGEIIEESATHLTVETQHAGGTILSAQVIPKSHVASITRATPEDRAYKALAKFTLNPDRSASLAACDEAIGELKKFLQRFPASARAAEVENRLAQWEAERHQVAAGLLRVGDLWLTKEEHERREARLKAQTLIEQGQNALMLKRWGQAVNAFDAALALQPGGTAELLARQQLTAALQGLREDLGDRLRQLEADLAAAQQRFDRAQQARAAQSPPATFGKGTGGGSKLGGGVSSETLHAASDYPAAEANLKSVQAQLDHLRQQLALVEQRLGAPAPAAAPAKVAPAAEPTPSEGVLEATAAWWKEYWMVLAGGAVVLLWLLSRFVSR